MSKEGVALKLYGLAGFFSIWPVFEIVDHLYRPKHRDPLGESKMLWLKITALAAWPVTIVVGGAKLYQEGHIAPTALLGCPACQNKH